MSKFRRKGKIKTPVYEKRGFATKQFLFYAVHPTSDFAGASPHQQAKHHQNDGRNSKEGGNGFECGGQGGKIAAHQVSKEGSRQPHTHQHGHKLSRSQFGNHGQPHRR